MKNANSNLLTPADQKKWQALAQDVLQQAKNQGATAAAVSVDIGTGLSASVRMGEVDTVAFNRDKGLSLTVYMGHRRGSASTSDLEAKAIEDVLLAACGIANISAEDKCFGLAEADLMARDYADLELYHPWDLAPENAIKLARECEAIALTEPQINNSEGAHVSSYGGFHVYANTHGFVGERMSSRHNIDLILLTGKGDQMQRDYYYTTARDRADLESINQVAAKATERTLARVGARRLSTRKAAVIYAADVAKSLFSHFLSAISGGNLYRRSSFLLDHLNKQIFPEFMHIHEQPHLLKGLASAAFDAEGVKTQAKDFIKAGCLCSYALGSYSARRLGLQTTANAGGVYNLMVEPKDMTRAALLKKMNTGLLVTELIGQGIDIVNGDYSRGAAGFWVENGEIQYPVHEITIAGNLRDIFMGIQAIANDIDTRSSIQTGSVLIDTMMIAGE
ncbi:MAG: metalloprotease PmbA [Gammaproteobacteria bacterium]